MQSNSNTAHMIRYSDIPSSTSSPDVEDSPITTSHRNQISTMPENHLIASQICEQGHVYSLATNNNLLYTGSDSKNIQIRKNLQPLTAIKSTSGLVKAIVIFNRNKIFTGHQDGKIRIWKINPENPNLHKCVATLPTMIDVLKASARPKNYVQVRRHRSEVWIKHADAISCLSVDEGNGMLYSASWDRTFKVWSMRSLKCVESVSAHDDAVNAVVVGGGGLVYTGSADGTVKVWKRELESGNSKMVRHVLEHILLRQECAVTSLAVNESGTIVYCGSSDGLVNFWERKKKLSHGGVLRGHKMAVLCLAAAGNNIVLSGSADKSICVWRRDIESVAHTCLSVLRGHTGPVKCLAVAEEEAAAADCRKWVVYSGSLDKSVKVWRVSDNMAPDFCNMDLMKMQECNRDFKYNWESIPFVEY